jgi:DNA-binding response OmpR family regulator
MTRILVVDDEPGIVRFLRRALESAGYDVDTAVDGPDALRRASAKHFDLIILDLLLPGLNGMAVLSAVLEQDPSARVLVLSAVGGVPDRVRCLERGAVDFLAKPFALAELLARVRARVHDHADVPAAPGIQVGDVRLDPTRRTVYVGETPVELSGREFLVMTHLMSHAGETVSRQELLSDIWGLTFDPGSNVVDVCVARLRAKIDGTRIETVRNVGYSFRSA